MPNAFTFSPRGPSVARMGFIAACVLYALSCADAPTAPPVVASISVEPESVSVASGSTVTLAARLRDERGRVLPERVLVWTSSDPAVAAVTPSGVVSASLNRTASPQAVTVTATLGTLAASATVRVLPVPATQLRFAADTASLRPGGSVRLRAVLLDAGADTLRGRPVAYRSADTTIAVVDDSGQVTARPFGGTAVRPVSVIASAETVADTAVVTVLPAEIAVLALDRDSAEVGVEDSLQLAAALSDASGTPLSGRAVTWVSRDTAVLRVSDDGWVRAATYFGPDLRTAVVVAEAGGQADSARITVQPVAVASLQLAADSVMVVTGDSITVGATVLDAQGRVLTGRSVFWSSTDTTVATATSSGVVRTRFFPTAVARQALIVATAQAKADTLPVIVTPAEVAQVVVTPNPWTVNLRLVRQFSAALTDGAGRALTGRPVSWRSTDTTVVRVDASGNVFAPFSPSGVDRVVYVIAQAGGISDSSRVTVPPVPARSVLIQPRTLHLVAGTDSLVAATVADSLGRVLTDRPLSWALRDSTFASVDAVGRVTAQDTATSVPLRTTLLVTSGSLRDSIPVTVRANTPPVDGRLAVADGHTCAVTVNDVTLCWGYNALGPIGDGSVVNRTQPVAVSGGRTFSRIATSSEGTCALDTQGALYCWGDTKTGTTSATPVPLAPGITFTSLAAHANHLCGLTAGGAAMCWGENQNGQLGDSSFFNDRPSPVVVQGGHTFVEIVVGGSHSCGLYADGRVFCWGDNSNGKLGDGTIERRLIPTEVQTAVRFVRIAAASSSTCGLTLAGEAYCWGFGGAGQLGDGTVVSRSLPGPVTTEQRFVRLSGGNGYWCGLTATGAAYCWGNRSGGALGNGVDADALVPTAVAGGLEFVALDAGWGRTCGITTGGDVYCWGYNDAGLLGVGNPGVPQQSVPALVIGGHLYW